MIESDDWGSIRMPSKKVFNQLKKKGIQVEKDPYCKNDSLATAEDLSNLFEVLTSFKDFKGNNPVITANTVVANPDFQKIRNSNFSNYYYEPFTKTLKKYPHHSDAFKLWQEGIHNGFFYPQFHGREHLNIELWMEELQKPDSFFRQLFPYQLWGVSSNSSIINGTNIQAAYDTNFKSSIKNHEKIIEEGLDLFEKVFGFRSKSFIANNFIYHSDLNRTLKDNGISYVQGMKYQKLPKLGNKKRGLIRHYTGEKNDLGQYYLVRNCQFEPSQKPTSHDSVDSCLKDISNAFFWKRPAIIMAHRLNFVGSLNSDNRDKNLKRLNTLFKEMLKRWSNVEFVTSDQLGLIIEKEKNSK